MLQLMIPLLQMVMRGTVLWLGTVVFWICELKDQIFYMLKEATFYNLSTESI